MGAPEGGHGVSNEVTVVVPCWNEEGNVTTMAAALREVAPRIGAAVTVIFVDDASTDGTWGRIVEACEERAPGLSVRGLRLVEHAGKAAAQAAGLRQCAPGSAVVFIDGDGQHPVASLPDLVQRSAECDTPVLASRQGYGRGLVPTLGTWGMGAVMRLLGTPFDSSLSEYAAIPPRTAAALVRSPQLGVAPIVPLIQGHSNSYVTLPVEILPRSSGLESPRWSFTALWHKALLQLLADPWRLLPRMTILAVLGFVILGFAAVAAAVRAIVVGTSPGTVAILGAVVIVAGLSVGMWVVSMVIAVMTLRSVQASLQGAGSFTMVETYDAVSQVVDRTDRDAELEGAP